MTKLTPRRMRRHSLHCGPLPPWSKELVIRLRVNQRPILCTVSGPPRCPSGRLWQLRSASPSQVISGVWLMCQTKYGRCYAGLVEYSIWFQDPVNFVIKLKICETCDSLQALSKKRKENRLLSTLWPACRAWLDLIYTKSIQLAPFCNNVLKAKN